MKGKAFFVQMDIARGGQGVIPRSRAHGPAAVRGRATPARWGRKSEDPTLRSQTRPRGFENAWRSGSARPFPLVA